MKIVVNQGSPQRGNSSRGKHSPRQYRRQLNIIRQGMPPGQYLAYCVVSKQSQMGLFVHQRLLTLDSFRHELSYYSDIPELPLTHVRELGKPKQTVSYKNASRFEFALERIRIGHVTVRWNQKNQLRSWKLIMGSNSLAQQFYELMQESLTKRVGEPVQKQSERRDRNRQYENHFEKYNKPRALANSEPHLPNPAKFTETTIQPSPYKELEGPENKGRSSPKVERATKNIVIDSHRNLQTQSTPKFSQFNPLQIKAPAPPFQPSPSSSLVTKWLTSTSAHQRAQVYHKFTTLCQQKVTTFMQNFYYNHLKHQEEQGMCVWWQGELKVMYCPLIQSLEEGSVGELLQRIKKEETYVRGWESLDYLAGVHKLGEVMICVPMSCVVVYHSMLFFCRSTIEQMPGKYLIRDWKEHQTIVDELESKIHTKIINNLQKVYWLELDNNQEYLYFQQLWCLPDISSLHPVTQQYLSQYITNGVISSNKDKQAIRQHINNNLLQQTIQIIHTKQITTSFELIYTIEKLGLSQHYLPLLLAQSRSRNTFVQRLIMSQLVAVGVEWEIRQKMQLQLFRKKETGYALNQVKFSLNRLLQGDKGYLNGVAKLIEEYYGQSYDLRSCPLQTYIIVENTLLSVFCRLALDCKIYSDDVNPKSWLYEPKNIDNNIELKLFLKTRTYKSCIFRHEQTSISSLLFEDHTYQINKQTSLLSVLSRLNLKQNLKGQYTLSPQYLLLSWEEKRQVSYFLSHYIQPRIELTPVDLLQSQIYSQYHQLHYCVSSLDYLTALNRVRWMIKANQQHQVYSLVSEMIMRATLWGQYSVLIQIYGFYSQYKLRVGDIKTALGYSQLALQSAFEHYENEKTVLVALLIAEQAFQAANIHLMTCNYSKAIELYSSTQSILKGLSTEGEQFTLNPEFVELYSKKCGIYLLFGEYQNCLDECLEGIECCTRIKNVASPALLNEYEFKIYAVLFRCYQIQKMRRQMIEVADICSQKYIIDPMVWGEQVNQTLVIEVIKILWESVVKEVESVSPIMQKESDENVKFVYLKTVYKAVLALRNRQKQIDELESRQVIEYIKLRVMKYHKEGNNNTLKSEIVKTLVAITNSPQIPESIPPPTQPNLDHPYTLLACMLNLTAFPFLLGSLQSSLHIYTFQY